MPLAPALLTASALFFVPSRLWGAIQGENLFEYRQNSVTGDRSQAFRKRNESIIEELALNGRFQSGRQTSTFFNFRGRAADDKAIEPKKWALQRFSAGWKSPGWEGTLGDVAPEYPEFILTQGLRGGQLMRRLPAGEDLTAEFSAGSTAANWERLWGAPGNDFKQYAWTGRLSQSLANGLQVGASYVSAWDDTGSLSTATALVSRRNDVYGADLDWPLARWWSLRGEAASSRRNYDGTRARVTKDETDSAFRVENTFKYFQWTVRGRYYRANPKFESLVGSAAADSEQSKASLRGPAIHPKMRLELSYGQRRDNLKGQKVSATRVKTPEAGWEWDVSDRLQAGLTARSETRRRDDRAVDETNTSYLARFQRRGDRLSWSLGGEHRNQDNKTAAGQDHRLNLGQAAVSLALGEPTSSPVLRLESNFISDETVPTGQTDSTLNVGGGFFYALGPTASIDLSHRFSGFDTEVANRASSNQNQSAARLTWKSPRQVFGARTETSVEWVRKGLNYLGSSLTVRDVTENLYNVSVRSKF
ncbi:MAG: hypothetical protein HY548_04025 [Elusimicrobia bacterium]|nr:hypothetical protein [Elusimicrobiota bacterium]